jgi:hypothetical protein
MRGGHDFWEVAIILTDVPLLLMSAEDWLSLYWQMYHCYSCLQETGCHYTDRCTTATPVCKRLVAIILTDVPLLLPPAGDWLPLYWQMYHCYSCLQETVYHYTDRCTTATPVCRRLVAIILTDVPLLLPSAGDWLPLYWQMYHWYSRLQETGCHYTDRCTTATPVCRRLVAIILTDVPQLLPSAGDWLSLYWQMYHCYY